MEEGAADISSGSVLVYCSYSKLWLNGLLSIETLEAGESWTIVGLFKRHPNKFLPSILGCIHAAKGASIHLIYIYIYIAYNRALQFLRYDWVSWALSSVRYDCWHRCCSGRRRHRRHSGLERWCFTHIHARLRQIAIGTQKQTLVACRVILRQRGFAESWRASVKRCIQMEILLDALLLGRLHQRSIVEIPVGPLSEWRFYPDEVEGFLCNARIAR
jgi:hypothetical protein